MVWGMAQKWRRFTENRPQNLLFFLKPRFQYVPAVLVDLQFGKIQLIKFSTLHEPKLDKKQQKASNMVF